MLWQRLFAIVAAFGAAALTLACAPPDVDDPRLRNRSVEFDAAALTRFLSQSVRLEGTPLAATSRAWLDRAHGCALLRAYGEANDPTPLLLECGDSERLDPSLAQLLAEHRGTSDGILFWPIGQDGRLELRLDVDPAGGLSIEGLAVMPEADGPLALLIPDAEPPARSVLSRASSWLYARGRPQGGLRLTRFLPPESQADRLFALRGRLLEGALLSGTWELALLPPIEGGEVPLAVAALHHRAEAALLPALSEALDQLEATWPIRRTSRRFGLADGTNAEGGCFFDLPILPELEPCWVVTPRALVIGYHGDAIEATIGPPPVSAAPDLTASTPGTRLELQLDRIERSDRRRQAQPGKVTLGALFSGIDLQIRPEGPRRVGLSAQLTPSAP